MTPENENAQNLLASDRIAELPELHIRHPWNDKSDVFIKRLSSMAGLTRIALSLARVPPGKESFVYHRHERDEEFVYILSGRGRAEIGEDVFEVGPGDFMGFAAPGGPAHHLINPYDEDLVYLMGGESSGFDIGHFPRLGRRIIHGSTGIEAIGDDDCEQLTLDQFLVDDDG
ncbi:MAG: cupin domain-containing protein [Rhodospirillales bacterium]|nr:cupin domain-containing protein [Rhodospirillales bacterium]